MRYIDFRQVFKTPIFTSQDIRLLATDITPSQLTMWQKQDYITKIRGGVYLFNDAKDKITSEELSAVVIEPSYISLESALFKYNLIPEVIFATTCITTKNTRTHNTYLGYFSYQHIKPDLYFGYTQQSGFFRPYLIAEPEKAILDFFYLHTQYKNIEDIKGLRIDMTTFYSLNQKKIDLYSQLFPSRIIRIIKLLRNQNA
ncbi:MAG: hypothetical protein ABIJ43_03615 [Candidatus Beckwithbacteria bacterium]|nr:hypothetical protein [Patescibacteria group bacterium]